MGTPDFAVPALNALAGEIALEAYVPLNFPHDDLPGAASNPAPRRCRRGPRRWA